MRALAPHLSAECTLTADGLIATSRKHTESFDALEVVLKGPEISLGGMVYLDKDGHPRKKARLAWWDPDATTLDRAARIPGGSITPTGEPFGELPATPVEHDQQYHDHIPVIVGHYWFTGTPERLSSYVACVDYSAAANGPLVAYRWNGEAELDDRHFVSSPI
jgi:hypothetical protein